MSDPRPIEQADAKSAPLSSPHADLGPDSRPDQPPLSSPRPTPRPTARAGARGPARPSTRIRPLVAWRAIRKLVADPDDTETVFVLLDALGGRSGERLFRRFRTTEVGRRVLDEQRDIMRTLLDQTALRALPEGSLGRTYADFMSSEQLSADGLVAASGWQQEGVSPEERDRVRFGARLRDTHDLWHVVTGYNRDLVGEAALLAFSYAQTRNPGIGFIVLAAYWLARGDVAHGRRMMRDAYRRGKAAAWLPGADWESLLARPLAEVRRALSVGEAPIYTQVRSAAGEAALVAR